jgi:predicted metalloprotease with PDZ domain
MSQANRIRYRIVPIDLAAHLFEIGLEIDDPDPSGQRVSLPAWIPGQLHDPGVRAQHRGRHRRAPGRWRSRARSRSSTSTPGAQALALGRARLRCTYRVYAWDLSVRAAHLDSTHGFFNGTSVFLRVAGP